MLYRQPQFFGLQIDWSNPLTRGLVFLSSQFDPRDMIGGRAGAPSGTVTKVAGPLGMGTRLGSSSSYTSYANTSAANVLGDITCFALGYQGSVSADAAAFAKTTGNGATDTPFDFGTGSGGTVRLGRANTGYRVWVSSATLSANQTRAIAATQATGINQTPRFYIDGKFDTGSPSSIYGGGGSGAAGTNSVDVRAQNRSDNGVPWSGGSGGLLYVGAVWNRVLSDAEIASLSINPWQLYIDPADELVLAAAAASSFTYTGSGGLSFGGAATAVEANDYAASGAGGLAFGGAASSVYTTSYTVSGAGGLTFSGAATASTGADFVAAGAGGLLLAGSAGAVYTASHVFAPSGGMLFSGSASASLTIAGAGTTGAVLYLRPRIGATLKAARQTGAAVFLSPRWASGLWSSAGEIPASRDLKSLKTWLPPSNVPIGYLDNDRTKPVFIDSQTWYQFLNYFVNVFIGGPSAPTLADVTSAVTTASVQSAESAAVVSAVSQQVVSNAEALAATVEVAKNNALTGASQIPPVQKYGYGMEP